MKVIGITGGIASGKSTVARMFAAQGAKTLSADEDARAVLAEGSATRDEVFAAFPDTRRADGTLDRAALGAMIFADPAARQRLDSLMHPAIFARMAEAIATYRDKAAAGEESAPLLVYEVPLLFENNRQGMFDAVIAVYAPPETQSERLQQRQRESGRPPLTGREILDRLAAQLSGEEKARQADLVIRTDISLKETEAAVARIYRQFTESEPST